MKLLTGLFNCEVKANGDGTFDFIGSDSSVDRDGEIIEVKGWDLKQFNRNPVILFGHQHGIPAIARAKKAVIENGKLMIKGIRFAKRGIHKLADTVHDLVVDKIMNMGSVGFIAHDREFVHRDEATGKKPKASIITKKAELHEFSMVNVGSNRNAFRVKGLLDEDGELNVQEILTGFPKELDIKKIEEALFSEEKTPTDPPPAPAPAKTLEDVIKTVETLQEKVTTLTEQNENLIKVVESNEETKNLYDAILDGDPETDHEDPPQKGSLSALFDEPEEKPESKKLTTLFN